MKKHLSAALAAAILTLSLTAGLTACHKDTAPDVELTTDEAATLPEISLPDLTDDRTYTDTTPYAQRLDNLFAETPVTPASDFTYESTEGGVTVTGYTGGEIVVVIPDTLDGNPVVAIAEKAFAGNGSLKAVSVPDTVTDIGKGAFEGCKAMTSLRTPARQAVALFPQACPPWSSPRETAFPTAPSTPVGVWRPSPCPTP